MWDHTSLLATRQKRTHAAVTPASKAGTWFIYPRGMEGWVDLVALILSQPGVEPATAKSKVWHPNRCVTKTPAIKRVGCTNNWFIAGVQEAFDRDVKAGHISPRGWNNSASAMGRLGYKLILQTGDVNDPVDITRVCVARTHSSCFGFRIFVDGDVWK